MEKFKLPFLDYEYAKYLKEKYYELLKVNSADFADIKLSKLNLSVRSINVLNNMSLYTVEDILNFYPFQLARFQGCGKKTFNEINICLLKFLKVENQFEQIIITLDGNESLYLFF